MESFIGRGAIKIACIQTLPGYELEVKSKFEKACQAPEIKNHIFLKGFGSFDIILLYSTEDFGYHLRKAGPIPHVLKSNLLLCYPYLATDVDAIFKQVSDSIFTGFCLLKISPGLKNYYPNIDELLREFVAEQENKWSMLGSLGWNELTILISDDNPERIIDQLHSIGSLYLKMPEENFSAIIKTLSFLGIDYSILPPIGEIERGFRKTKSFTDKTPSLKQSSLNNSESNISANLEVTVKPLYSDEVKKYFIPKGFEAKSVIGKADIIIQPKKEMSWSHLLATVLFFRHKFKHKIFSTSTRISLIHLDKLPVKCKEKRARLSPYGFEYPQLEDIFGKDMGSTLANHFYTLNSLFQDPLCGSVYADMLKYPEYIATAGAQLKEAGGDTLFFAQGAREVIKFGAELRSYGTHETIEEVTGRFSEFRGGCQLALLAMEFLPLYVLEDMGIEWMGFIITGDPKFFHINEVINVPNHALWNPQQWWALYHEIAHVMLDNLGDWINYQIPSIQQFLSNKNNHRAWLDTIVELAAEVIGFELGFFGDFNTFLRLLWEHLREIDPYQKANIPIANYAIRTFFVQIFQGHFRRYSNVEKVSKDDFTDLDFLYTNLIEHMNTIESELNNPLFEDKYFIAAENAKLLKELYPFASHLSKKMSEMQLRPENRSLRLKNTEEVIESLKAGRIWWKEIASPQAILYHLLQEQNLKLNSRVATILTFWNQQMLRFRERYG